MRPQVRSDIGVRDGYRCVRCGADATHGGTWSIHHRKFKPQGGTDDPWNLILLCGDGTTGCHALVHSLRADIGEPGGYVVPAWADPADIPVVYHRRGPRLLTSSAHG